MVYWLGYVDPKMQNTYEYDFFWRILMFSKINREYPDTKLFNDKISFLEPIQHTFGNCYLIAGMTAMYNHPELIKEAFLIKEKNKAGIYAVRLFFRSRPVTIVIDDAILMIDDEGAGINHRFAKVNPLFKTVWPIVLEKAFAKLKGNYLNMHGGYMSNVFKSILGVPSSIDYMVSFHSNQDVWNFVKKSFVSNYPIGFSTDGDDDSQKNECGVTKNHAFALITMFTIFENGKHHQLIMLRNPRHETNYDKEFGYSDPIWNDPRIRNQVPFNIDPRLSSKEGIFIVPHTRLMGCFEAVYIGYTRNHEGYVTTWYDVEDDDGTEKEFEIFIPENNGTLYITVESYMYQMIPIQPGCMVGKPRLRQVYYRDNELLFSLYNEDIGGVPIIIEPQYYRAGQTIRVVVDYEWRENVKRDFTVSVYSR